MCFGKEIDQRNSELALIVKLINFIEECMLTWANKYVHFIARLIPCQPTVPKYLNYF